jgi:hypothetical protein
MASAISALTRAHLFVGFSAERDEVPMSSLSRSCVPTSHSLERSRASSSFLIENARDEYPKLSLYPKPVISTTGLQ